MLRILLNLEPDKIKSHPKQHNTIEGLSTTINLAERYLLHTLAFVFLLSNADAASLRGPRGDQELDVAATISRRFLHYQLMEDELSPCALSKDGLSMKGPLRMGCRMAGCVSCRAGCRESSRRTMGG